MELLEHEKKHINQLSPYLSECTLFLKKDGSFPLDKPGKIAAYGSGIRHTIKGGTGSGDVYSRFFVNIEKGLTDAGFEITTNDWLTKYDEITQKSRKTWIKNIKKEAKAHHVLAPIYGMGAVCPAPEYDMELDLSADSAIYVVSRISGEGNDRKAIKGDALLTDSEIRDILRLNKEYKNFMLVINAGGVIDLEPVLEVRNILLLSELGVETGKCLADILLGKANPSGKLSSTWAKFSTYPYPLEFDVNDTPYEEGIYVGYRYFDSFNVEPLFPFGYGLSYSEFEISDLKVKKENKKLILDGVVKNISKFEGKEVIQVYISKKNDNVYQQLVSFIKTQSIKPNQKDNIKCDFSLNRISKYDEDRKIYYISQGEYLVRVGNSSKNTKVVVKLVVDEEIILKKVDSIVNKVDVKELHTVVDNNDEFNGEVIHLTKDDFQIDHYEIAKVVISDTIKNLDDIQLATLNCGYVGVSISVVGEASESVPGAAGQTSSLFRRLFSKSLVLADGPAGLRISPRYVINKKGKPLEIDKNAIADEVLEFLPKFIAKIARTFFVKDRKVKKGQEIHYQYTTALPISTAIAQSWNKDFAELCGDIIGEEMEIYNVDIWLAPALNIHRHILCGRNFEYFSEDPLISGLMAAYITRGVQKHKGRGVTIKHFAANNQETSRYTNNSVVNERALREIYLRGFEICLNESSPKAVMTSYNLLNGIHTSENRELIYDFLYKENGYQGIVMTDWVVHLMDNKKTKYRFPRADYVANTGTSLMMPGSKKDINDIRKGLKNNDQLRNQIKENIARLENLLNELRG